MSARAAMSMVGEEKRFHGLPPLKRFKLLEKEKVRQKGESEMTSEVGEEIILHKSTTGVKVLCCLPAKKRVCALQFFADNLNVEEQEEEQEMKTLLLASEQSSPLQPIHLNGLTHPTSVSSVENKGAMNKKKMGLPTAIAKENIEMKLGKKLLQNRRLPTTTEEVDFAAKLAVKKKDCNGSQHVYAPERQKFVDAEVIAVGEKQKTEMKPVRKINEANPAAIRLSADTPPTEVTTSIISLPMSNTEHDDSVAIQKKRSLNSEKALHHLKKSQATSVTDLHHIHDQQVSVTAVQLDKGVMTFGLEQKCADVEQKEESDGEDDGVFCDVCKEADADPSDPIVFCDGCNVMVHASCYGSPLIDGIPDGDWFCRRCESESGRRKAAESSRGHVGKPTAGACRRVCSLCPSRKGAMKQTTDGAWAHLSCALYVPEVFYRRARDREGIECGSVPTWRWELPCVVCATQGQGACIQCTEVGCCSTFHVSCALNAGLTIDYRNANTLTKTPAIVIAFCPSHSRQALTRSERRRFKIVPRC